MIERDWESEKQIKNVLSTWSQGDHITDQQLVLAITALQQAIVVLEGLKVGSVILSGFYLILDSMEKTQYYRERK